MFRSIFRAKQTGRAIKQTTELQHRLRVASSRTYCSDESSGLKVDFSKSSGRSTLVSVIKSAFDAKPRSTIDLDESGQDLQPRSTLDLDESDLQRRSELDLDESGQDVDTDSVTSDSSSPLSLFKERVSACNLRSLLRLIETELAEWKGSDELTIVYQQINHLFFGLVINAASPSALREEIQASPVFHSLLNHTDALVPQLSTGCLIKLFETFDWTDLDPQSSLFRNTLNELERRLRRLEFLEIVKCLNLFAYHLEKPFATAELFESNERFTEIALQHIMSDDLSSQSFMTIIQCFFFSLNSKHDPDNVAIDILVERLLSPDVQLSYKQSIRLLREIQLNYKRCRRKNEPIRYPTGLASLIEKCNSTIHRFIASGPTDHELYYYLVTLHRQIMSVEFSKVAPDFYDQSQNRLLPCLTPFLLEQFNFNDRFGYHLINLVQNYRNFHIYDVKLYERIYKLYLRDESLRARLNVRHIYHLLSTHQLPFVNHQQLAELFLPMLTNKSHKSFYSTKKDLIVFLNNLLLNNVDNVELLEYLVGQLNDLNDRVFKQFGFRDLHKLTLARACLVELNHLDEEGKLKIRSKLDEIINGCMSELSIEVSKRYFAIDPRLQRNGFLSNGVHLDAFGIYDHSTNELVPLTDYTDSFYKVEQIPTRLPENQEM